jgi:hypothetical protein
LGVGGVFYLIIVVVIIVLLYLFIGTQTW